MNEPKQVTKGSRADKMFEKIIVESEGEDLTEILATCRVDTKYMYHDEISPLSGENTSNR